MSTFRLCAIALTTSVLAGAWPARSAAHADDAAAAAPALPSVAPARPATPDDLDFRPGSLRVVTDETTGGRFMVFTYVIANKTGKTQRFAPRFDLLCGDGTILQAGQGVPAEVGLRLRRTCASAQALDHFQIMGEVQDGEANAKEGFVAWPAPGAADLKQLTLFVTGTSAAFDRQPGADGQPTIVRRTWVRHFMLPGALDPRQPAEASFDPLRDQWVMR